MRMHKLVCTFVVRKPPKKGFLAWRCILSMWCRYHFHSCLAINFGWKEVIDMLTNKTPPINYRIQKKTISNVAAFSKITNKAGYLMRMVCWQTILIKKACVIFSKINQRCHKISCLPKKARFALQGITL